MVQEEEDGNNGRNVGDGKNEEGAWRLVDMASSMCRKSFQPPRRLYWLAVPSGTMRVALA